MCKSIITDTPAERHITQCSHTAATQESKIQFVYDAVYALAHALHALIEDACGGETGSAGVGGGDPGRGGGLASEGGGVEGKKGGARGRKSRRQRCIRGLKVDGGELYKLYLLNVSFDG